MTTTIIDAQTCAWCDADGTQKKCYRCKDACRQPRLHDRQWTFQVTGNNGLLPFVFCAPSPPWNLTCNPQFSAVNGCCSRITAFPRLAPNNRSETSGVYQWRRISHTYSSIDYVWATCSNPSTGECRYIPPVKRCASTVQTALGCALGWRRIAGMTSASLYISRTKPRYGCSEDDECRYRVALVIEGEIGVTWGTQYTQGSQTAVVSSDPFCDLPATCVSGTSGIWPVGSPPPFDPARFAVTMHPFRSVLRRSVSSLAFPMVFNQDNAVGLSCGPQCAASISAITPTFGTPPELTCGPLMDLGSNPPPDFDNDTVNLCTPTACDDPFCDPPNFFNLGFSQENTLIGSSDSGLVTPGNLPDTAFPTQYTVELY